MASAVWCTCGHHCIRPSNVHFYFYLPSFPPAARDAAEQEQVTSELAVESAAKQSVVAAAAAEMTHARTRFFNLYRVRVVGSVGAVITASQPP